VIVRHHLAGDAVRHLGHPGHHALGAELEQHPSQAECLVAWSGGRLTELAGGQHDMRGELAVGYLVREQRPVGELQGREQRVLTHV
jgi:hypothetical protein